MALDEPQAKDFTVTDRGVTFAVEKGLFEKAKPICIDFFESVRGSGFKITSSLTTGGGCGDSCAC